MAVLPVGNDTVYELERVRFGGLLQRLTLGPQTYDVPALLRDSFLEALQHRGYDATIYLPPEASPDATSDGQDFTKPLPEGSPELPFDAALVSTIDSWYSAGSGQWKTAMAFEVKLYHVPTAELLYSYKCNCARTADSRGTDSGNLGRRFIISCARKSLGSLPVASE